MRRPVLWLLLLAVVLIALSQTDAGGGLAVVLWIGALLALLTALAIEVRDLRAARGRARRDRG
ncbi:hypothetical protein KQI48_11160 [Cellulomonas hominis]|uniref:Uncharacterized membrane protein YhaH (DUF805 family) n=1 Tax=Cellulomonas hominis TaxID=156981 RepID=A0A511FD62_9CELL|nr:hypothetical protein [Cellulomonas hominis]MBB5475320.1 uncharacterized membrane protein YhaH (DUF805 family) [Cellulomonas hominis]MBU5423224.1 hypothetical protein [Cellulomonas hominis]NKY07999.1 hypothetical protein [Cellulomonas hominis]NKY10749.1 hypothetical protein [Cellulomonas hominis]GEL47195.1 hypothetical protein CHO01_23110 [Cellulomonas hominis]